jgi:hypothetical protein
VETGQAAHPENSTDPARPVEKSVTCDWHSVKGTLRAAGQWLKNHATLVNALNVFPVPDGDTGTNMSLTMAAALAEMERSPHPSAVDIARAVAHGALMGARGNSGVILSQILRGLAHSLDGKDIVSTLDLAAAAQEAYDTALRGVIRPVDGTMLTVMRDVARAALETAAHTGDPVTLLTTVVEVAQDTTAHTPEMLAVLKEAGVVDAGGQGLVYLLEGALRYLRGENVTIDANPESAGELKPGWEPSQPGYGYDVQFLLHGEVLNVDEIRQAIDGMGESALVVGDSHLLKVHVHVHDAGLPLSYGVKHGSLSDVVVENMQRQHHQFLTQSARSSGSPTGDAGDATDIAVVCVASGNGLSRIFTSLHPITTIVQGGQTMNPSIQELLVAIDGVRKDKVLVLPNNGNIVPAAQQACGLSSKQAVVVPTQTIPQGISALMAFNYQAGLQDNARRMQEKIAAVRTVEMTRAVRSTQVNHLQVAQGDVIGLLDDQLVSVGPDYTTVALEVLTGAVTQWHEVVTIYFGQDAAVEEANALADRIEASYPQLEIETQNGGQPHYRYILSLE